MTAQDTFAATLVDEWARAGVRNAVVSPGSRSTPLALALLNDDRLDVSVVLDERAAGFVALGLGAAAARPAVVVTTSGTAAAEVHPAVVEAYQGRVPMIVCTADRPPELQDTGAPQTIDQQRLFARAVCWYSEPGVAREDASASWRPLAARAAIEAMRAPGPVHLNLAFVEPLIGAPEELPPGRGGGQPWHTLLEDVVEAPESALRLLADAPERGVIVAGRGAGEAAAVHAMAEALGWPVLADPRSGCRVPATTTVAAADALLRSRDFAAECAPDFVLRLGEPWASKVLEMWLSAAPYVMTVDPRGRMQDPTRVATDVVVSDPTTLCEGVSKIVRSPGRAWLDRWRAAEAAAQAAFDEVIGATATPTEPAVARAVMDAMPGGSSLVVSSSMPIRDLEWYGRPRVGVRVFANRGANGIDGVVSTAIGVSGASSGPCAALVGDLAFVHDIGSLAAARNTDLVVVVVDNNGGGIFSFLPQARQLQGTTFERLFGTPHDLDLAAIADAFGARVHRPASVGEVSEAVRAGTAQRGVHVVHVTTDREHNVTIHAAMDSAAAAAVNS